MIWVFSPALWSWCRCTQAQEFQELAAAPWFVCMIENSCVPSTVCSSHSLPSHCLNHSVATFCAGSALKTQFGTWLAVDFSFQNSLPLLTSERHCPQWSLLLMAWRALSHFHSRYEKWLSRAWLRSENVLQQPDSSPSRILYDCQRELASRFSTELILG